MQAAEGKLDAGGMDLFACCRSRGLEKGQARQQEAGAPVEKLCGLGIAFKPNKQGTLTVKRLVPGGPAAIAGTVEVPPHLAPMVGRSCAFPCVVWDHFEAHGPNDPFWGSRGTRFTP